MDGKIHNEDTAEGGREKEDKRWGLHISTAVSQWGRAEGRGMMDDREMKG